MLKEKRFIIANKLDIVSGTAFEHEGIKYPANWVDLATEEDLNSIGMEVVYVDIPAPVEENPLPKLIKKADIWRVVSDEELPIIESIVNGFNPRLKKIWDDSYILDIDSAEMIVIKDLFEQSLGSTRVEEILQQISRI